jgi:hypothetical protein
MGGTSSKSIANDLTNLCTKVVADSLLTCTGIATQSQILSYTQIKGNLNVQNINLSQGTSVDLKCVMDAVKQSDIASKVAESLAQAAEAKGEAVLSAFGSTKSAAISNLTTQIQNNISANTTADLETVLSQNQELYVNNVDGNVVMTNVTMSQSATEVASALMHTQTYSTVINATADTIYQKTSSQETNPIADIVSAMFQAPIMILAGLVLGVVLLILLFKLYQQRSS